MKGGESMRRTRMIVFITVLLLTTVLCGCTQKTEEKDLKISVVCTNFPQYDWVRQILGDKVNNIRLTLLLNNRIDLHNYQPSVDDMIKISVCDLFIYIGGGSDGWVDDVLKQAENKKMVVIKLLDTLGDAVKTAETIEGMEDEDDEDHDGDHEHESGLDEHVWLSLRNAQVFCAVIADALSALDKGHAEVYQSNAGVYIDQLSALDLKYRAALTAPSAGPESGKTLLFGDRFPFRYLTDDYGLNYYAAFAGCSAETEASFETIIFLVEKMNELGLKNVMVTESSDKKIAETIVRESKGGNHPILVLDAMQSVNKNDISNGATYLSIMESNLSVLKEALE